MGLTRRIYARWGAPSLIIAKFVPGFAAVATTLAGESGTSLHRFIFYDAIGAALWAGGAFALGAIFHGAIDAVLLELENLGHYAIILLVGAIVSFVALKWWQRYRFARQIRMTRISIDELWALLQKGVGTTLLDARTPEHRARQGWIPGAIQERDIDALALDRDREIVVYCDCPNDASAALVANKLKARGFSRVRPLAGGMQAWLDRGHPIEK